LEFTNLFLKEKNIQSIHDALEVTLDSYLSTNPENAIQQKEITEIFTLIGEHLVMLEMLAADVPQVK
jgi:hypothetical protein